MSFAKVIGTLSPWQLRGPNARPQKSGGLFEPSGGDSQMTLQILRILGNAVGHVMLHPVPYEFSWIQFRGIPGKEVGMNVPIIFQKFFDHSGLVHTAPVPQKHEPSLEVSQKVSQESQHLRIPDVLQGMKAHVQSDSAFTGRDADGRDRGYLRPSSGDFKNRRLSDERPSSPNGGHQAKPALIEEDQGNLKPFGLFLYAARYGASTVLFPSHPVLGPWSQAFDSLTQAPLKSSKHDPDDSSPRIGHRSLWPLFPASTNRLSSRISKGPQLASASTSASGARLVSQVYPAPVLALKHLLHFSYRGRSSNTPNLTNNRAFQLSAAESFRYPGAPRPAAYAFQALFGFHGVAWSQFTILLLLMRESIISHF